MTDEKDERRRATYEDVLNAPEHKVAEIIDGVLYLSPRPAFPHAGATTRLVSDLVGPFDRGRGGPGGWRLFIEPELHFGEDVLVPDIAGWRTSRMPTQPTGAFATLAPDWLCETLSPSTAKLDRTQKLRVYAREGVPHVWLVDPKRQTLEVLLLRGSNLVTQATSHARERVRAEPFDAVEIELAFLWGERPALLQFVGRIGCACRPGLVQSVSTMFRYEPAAPSPATVLYRVCVGLRSSDRSSR